MIEQLKDSDKIQVQNFGLVEWLKDLQEATQAGYEFDFETNEGYPQQIGHVYTCQMLPRSVELSADTTVYLKPTLEETVVIDFPPIVEPVEETKDILVIAPFATGGLLLDEQKVVGEQTSEQVVAQEATIVPKQETEKVTPEVQQPVKRGPKPKQ